MPFSKTFSLFILAGIVPVLAGSLFGGALYLFVLYNLLLFLLLVVDLIITPSAKSLEIQRICESKFSLGTENDVILSVRNKSRYRLELELKDEVPAYFKTRSKRTYITTEPYHESEGRYVLIPEKRGEFVFGKVHCKYNGVLRLCVKQAAYPLQANYKVYPNLKDLRRYTFAALKKSQLILGDKKVKSYGTGTEFESMKEYNEGDDYRKINWTATARTNRLMVNTYEPERNQQVYILLDASRVMNTEINYIKKIDYAINSSFLLAEIAIKKGDNIGLLVFDSSVRRYVKPGKGTGHFQLLGDSLYNVEEKLVSADYEGALTYLTNQQKRRSLLCIFTELSSPEEAIRLASALKHIARHHIPLVITIKDLRVYELVNHEVKAIEDVFDKSAAMKLIEEREKVKRIFQDSGIACIDIPPDQLSMEVVNKYLTMKSMMQI